MRYRYHLNLAGFLYSGGHAARGRFAATIRPNNLLVWIFGLSARAHRAQRHHQWWRAVSNLDETARPDERPGRSPDGRSLCHSGRQPVHPALRRSDSRESRPDRGRRVRLDEPSPRPPPPGSCTRGQRETVQRRGRLRPAAPGPDEVRPARGPVQFPLRPHREVGDRSEPSSRPSSSRRTCRIRETRDRDAPRRRESEAGAPGPEPGRSASMRGSASIGPGTASVPSPGSVIRPDRSPVVDSTGHAVSAEVDPRGLDLRRPTAQLLRLRGRGGSSTARGGGHQLRGIDRGDLHRPRCRGGASHRGHCRCPTSRCEVDAGTSVGCRPNSPPSTSMPSASTPTSRSRRPTSPRSSSSTSTGSIPRSVITEPGIFFPRISPSSRSDPAALPGAGGPRCLRKPAGDETTERCGGGRMTPLSRYRRHLRIEVLLAVTAYAGGVCRPSSSCSFWAPRRSPAATSATGPAAATSRSGRPPSWPLMLLRLVRPLVSWEDPDPAPAHGAGGAARVLPRRAPTLRTAISPRGPPGHPPLRGRRGGRLPLLLPVPLRSCWPSSSRSTPCR